MLGDSVNHEGESLHACSWKVVCTGVWLEPPEIAGLWCKRVKSPRLLLVALFQLSRAKTFAVAPLPPPAKATDTISHNGAQKEGVDFGLPFATFTAGNLQYDISPVGC